MNNNNYFIRDEIPRFLSKKIEENFELWFVGNPGEQDVVKKYLPDCIVNNMVFYNKLNDLRVLKENDLESSIIFVNLEEDKALYKMLGFKNVNYITEYFDKHYPRPIINEVDFIFCFGFNEINFKEFCVKNKSRGIMDNKEFVKQENPLTLSFFVDRLNSYQENYEKIKEFIKSQILEDKYELKNEAKTMGVTYQGNEETMASESGLPLLFY